MNNIKLKYKNLEKICDEKRFINSLYFLLKDNDYCFLRGSFIFEDMDEYLFNLLTIGTFFNNIDKKECKKITRNRGTICFTSHDSFLLDKKFQKKRKDQEIPFKIDDKYTSEKLMYKYIIRPFKSLSMYEKIINKHILIDCNGIQKTFKVILFYPFKLIIEKNKNYEKKMLFLKLEESQCFSISHIINYFKSKEKIKGQLLNTRREADLYTIKLYKNDIKFYSNIINKYIKDENIKKNIMSSVENYNDNIRVGSEFFIPNEILFILFDIYSKKLWE